MGRFSLYVPTRQLLALLSLRGNTNGDTSNCIIRYHVVQLVLSWTSHHIRARSGSRGGSKNPKGPPLAHVSFLFALGVGQKNQGSPWFIFLSTQGSQPKHRLFPKFFGSGRVKPPWAPLCAYMQVTQPQNLHSQQGGRDRDRQTVFYPGFWDRDSKLPKP